MIRKSLGAFIFLVISCSVYALVTKLPAPPVGYSWAVFEETKSAFLKPDGWFIKKMKKGETRSYFITKENIDKTGEFITGLSVNIVSGIPKKKGMSPVKYAKEFIQSAAASRKVA